MAESKCESDGEETNDLMAEGYVAGKRGHDSQCQWANPPVFVYQVIEESHLPIDQFMKFHIVVANGNQSGHKESASDWY